MSAHSERLVPVPAEGEFLVRDGKVLPVVGLALTDAMDGEVCYEVWVKQAHGE